MKMVNFTPRTFYPREKHPIPTEQRAGRASASVRTFWGTEKSFATAGTRTPCLSSP